MKEQEQGCITIEGGTRLEGISGKGVLGMKGNALIMAITESFGQGVLFLISPFWSLYILELGASLTIVGFLGLILGLTRITFQAPVGYLTDRMGRKRLVVWGGFISSLAPFVYFFATKWEHLILGVVLEASTNIVLPARQAMFADAIDPDKRASAFASIHTLFALFSSVMPVIGGYLLESIGFLSGMRLLFLVSGVVMILASLGRALLLKEDLHFSESPPEKVNFVRVIHEMFEPILNLKALRIVALGAFFYSIAVGILTKFSVVYVVDIIGLSTMQWGLVAGGIGVVGILTRIPIGWMVDRFSRKMCIFVSYALRPVFILAFTLATNFSSVILILMADNIFSYIQQPALEAFVADVASKERRGRTYGIMNMIPGITLTIAPMLGAFIWESYGAAWSFYCSAFFSALAAFVLLVFLQEPETKEV